MKISYMIKREDFYEINKKTLDEYYKESCGKTDLYIYPHLNAIVTELPSKEVKRYLLREFTVHSNWIKKIAVWLYVNICLCSRGIFATKKITIDATVGDNTLIYPCNRKYRIFDFERNIVDVIIKNGFNNNALINEIDFRTRENIPSFVPTLVSSSEREYTETIIDGMPLARIEKDFEMYRNKAYKIFTEYSLSTKRIVSGEMYAKKIVELIEEQMTEKVDLQKVLNEIVAKLIDYVKEIDEIPLCFSHGDMQPGNIWIEYSTNKIYIIDWESWGIRSIWYDKATLFDGLRMGIEKYLVKDTDKKEKAVILLEDIIFQLNELNNLPLEIGKEQFRIYMEKLALWSDI